MGVGVVNRRKGALARLKKQLAGRPTFTLQNGIKKQTSVEYVKEQIAVLEKKLQGVV
jgi:hypothetical protein